MPSPQSPLSPYPVVFVVCPMHRHAHRSMDFFLICKRHAEKQDETQEHCLSMECACEEPGSPHGATSCLRVQTRMLPYMILLLMTVSHGRIHKGLYYNDEDTDAIAVA